MKISDNLRRKGSVLLLLFASFIAVEAQEPFEIDGSMGKIRGVITLPPAHKDGKCDFVILMHGFNANQDYPLLRTIGDSLLRHGIGIVRFDFNAHGKSDGKFCQMTIGNETDDAHRVYSYIRSLPYVRHISLAGHSQGGVVAGLLAAKLGKKAIKSVLLLAPAAVIKDDILRGNIFGTRFNSYNLPNEIIINYTLHLGKPYLSEVQQMPIYHDTFRYRGRVCIIHGMGDYIVPYTYGEYYHDGLRHSELHLLPHANHSFEGHEAEVARIVIRFF